MTMTTMRLVVAVALVGLLGFAVPLEAEPVKVASAVLSQQGGISTIPNQHHADSNRRDLQQQDTGIDADLPDGIDSLPNTEMPAEVAFPNATDANICPVELNTTRTTCDSLIAATGGQVCECYNFCGNQLVGCHGYIDPVPAFDCPIADMIVGCRGNYEPPPYNKQNEFMDGNNPYGLTNFYYNAGIPNNSQTHVPCPPGYICDKESQFSCDTLRALMVFGDIGDVHAGAYCPGQPNRTNIGYQLCPIGHYCPNSTTKLPCPAGYFCPHKTQTPTLVCSNCAEGATDLGRHLFGYVLIAVVAVLILLVFFWVMFKRYNKEAYLKLKELQERSADTVRDVMNHASYQRRIQALKPKLEVIQKRINAVEHSSLDLKRTKTNDAIEIKDGKIMFNAEKLFDCMDKDNSGDLDYSELNEILKLKPLQLREFVYRMNKAAGKDHDSQSVSRYVFVKHFISILEATSHFEPTPEECEELYDELAALGKGKATHCCFFKSSIARYLSEAQINELLKRFEKIKSSCIDDPEGGADAAPPRRGRRKTIRVPSMKNVTASVKRRGTLLVAPSMMFGISERDDTIRRELFVSRYPGLLTEVMEWSDPNTIRESRAKAAGGVDIAFRDLCLSVKVKDKSVNVVNNVTGRLQSGTMTALMGGSGAGKTSLLNALCGRAFYGEVTGDIRINGHKTSIEEHADAVGFVPQDDIVYAELTVRENLIFSGKFQLPKGTPMDEIEDLADETMANLGLSRIMNSVVGDVHRRGVSGGEKKRVNIGLELMSRPNILFLDEPTSGLDASSALLVMKSLRDLVDVQGVTVCSVIHQPRKFIFELFDSLILLGVGGNLVYHGPVSRSEKYFNQLKYQLPAGESIADWLIDISSGDLAPMAKGGGDGIARQDTNDSQPPPDTGEAPGSNAVFESPADAAKARREYLYETWRKNFAKLSTKKRALYDAPDPFELPESRTRTSFWRQLGNQLQRHIIVWERNILTKLLDSCIIVGAVILISLLDGVVKVTYDWPQDDLSYDSLTSPDTPQQLFKELPKLFQYTIWAMRTLMNFNMKLGVVTAVLVGLTATKIITEKRVEFFREAGSGYNVNAYFVAVNIVSTIEHSLQVLVASLFALWIRNSIAVWYSYLLHFLLLGWLCVSWALFFPLVIPEKSIVLVTGFFMTFAALLFSGGIPPIRYNNIYANPGTAVFSGLVSPTRYFIEGMTVAESRCLPAQSGYTDLDAVFQEFPEAQQVTGNYISGLGLNDYWNVMQRSCNGWYWGAIPALLVGFWIRWMAAGLIHVVGRSKQAKKPITHDLNCWTICKFLAYFVVLLGLMAAAIYFMLRQTS